ncbi:MAG TPA: threonine/serine dehydratase [Longimicrobiales bacterium]|nr:threonine/serine dehydratase [Longimicrobiales bacterium]
MLHIRDIQQAGRRLAGRVHRTPVLTSRTLDRITGATLFLKPEMLQRTGSFKVRGVLNRIADLEPEERQRGIITISAGNHGQAVAFAAAAEGVNATVVMPAHATPAKVEACRDYGANVVLHGDIFGAFERMEELRQRDGGVLIHPFDDPAIMAGQGTVALEICDDVPELDAIVIPAGGGGLLSGASAAMKALQPGARVIGVEPTGAAAILRGMEVGKPVRLDAVDTIADGLGAPMTSSDVLAHVRAFVDDMVVVTDDQIRAAMRLLLERCKLLTEPAGAAALAAVLAGVATVPGTAGRAPRIAVVLSGGNIDMPRLAELLTDHRSNPED